MTRYTQLRHAGYYNPDLSDAQKQEIANQVDGKPAAKTKTSPPKTTSKPKARA